MRAHMITHDPKRKKVICSVKGCKKKYANLNAWAVHFDSIHHKQKQHFNKYKNKLGFEEVVNVTNPSLHEQIEKLMSENAKLKMQMRKMLNIRCGMRVSKRYKSIRLKPSNQSQNSSDIETEHRGHSSTKK